MSKSQELRLDIQGETAIFQIGDRVRENGWTVKQSLYLQFFAELQGNDWDDVPDVLEGEIVGEKANTPTGDLAYDIRYTNAPSWAPKIGSYYATHLELVG